MSTPPGFAQAEPIIHLGRSVVERLSREVQRAFQSTRVASMEIGGVLLGKADLHASNIEIKNFALFPNEIRPDRRFVLSDLDCRALQKTVEARRSMGDGELIVIGCFRSDLGEGLSLSEEDLSLARVCRCESSTVFLLVKPSPDGSARARFFLWEEGHIDSGSNFIEFPFDTRQALSHAEPVRASDSHHRDAAPPFVEGPLSANFQPSAIRTSVDEIVRWDTPEARGPDASGPKISLAPLGWTPNICAILAAVLCALMASTATLAFRLGG